MTVLVLVEHGGGRVSDATLAAVTAAPIFQVADLGLVGDILRSSPS